MELLNLGDSYEAAIAVLNMTQGAARGQPGMLTVPDGDVYRGPYTAEVMPVFAAPRRGRFNDETFGAWYAGDRIETAKCEKAYHLARWLSQSKRESYDLRFRVVQAKVSKPLENARRGRPGVDDAVYDPDPDRCGPGIALASAWLANGAFGLLYDSVRAEGVCVAVLRPCALTDVKLTRQLLFIWDGHQIKGFQEL
jgi:RES domain-containing protein